METLRLKTFKMNSIPIFAGHRKKATAESLYDKVTNYWPLTVDGDDAVGSVNLAQISGGTDVTFDSDDGAEANGTNLCGLEAAASNIPLTGAFSVSFMININVSASDIGWIFSKRNASDRQWQLFHNSNALRLSIGSSSDNISNGVTLAYGALTDVWTHVVFTFDGGTTTAAIKSYIDKVDVTDTSSSNGTFEEIPSPSTAKVRLFDPEWSTSRDVNGKVKDLRIWNTNLSQEEINTLYADDTA